MVICFPGEEKPVWAMDKVDEFVHGKKLDI